MNMMSFIFFFSHGNSQSRLSSEQEDALVGASGKLENELKRCLTIRTLAQFYDVEVSATRTAETQELI